MPVGTRRGWRQPIMPSRDLFRAHLSSRTWAFDHTRLLFLRPMMERQWFAWVNNHRKFTSGWEALMHINYLPECRHAAGNIEHSRRRPRRPADPLGHLPAANSATQS